MTRIPDDAFVKQVHRALRHLYEPLDLRMSPLVAAFSLGNQPDIPSSLRNILLAAIHALKPGPKAPDESNAWRAYQVLCYRFEEQFSQEEVAEQMAISPRQVRRLEFTGIRALADHLAQQYRLETISAGSIAEPGAEDRLPNLVAKEGGDIPENEFDWLKKTYQREATEVAKLVESAIRTGDAMFKAENVDVQAELPPNLPAVFGQITTLRQALLNILIAGMRFCPGRAVFVQAAPADAHVVLDVWVVGDCGAGEPDAEIEELLEMARRLAELSDCRLEILPASAERPFAARLYLRVVEKKSVLFVDDNEDSLNLMQRYLSGTTFEFYSTRNPEEVIEAAEGCSPSVIVLDIMLPDIDGWEVLGRLRAHPSFDGIPVVISTILPHEKLASSLGAAGFLRKPVSRETLLQLLGQLAGL